MPQACEALRRGDFDGFLSVIRQSGASSYMYLQNVSPAGAVEKQEMAVTLALCEHYLDGAGAYRVHGGGFAGTCQAFVPWSDWKPSGKESTVCWEKAPVMCFPFVSRWHGGSRMSQWSERISDPMLRRWWTMP